MTTCMYFHLFFSATGNDFNGMTIKAKGIIDRAKQQNYPFTSGSDGFTLQSPDGYKIYVKDLATEGGSDPVQNVIINSNDLAKTELYWTDLLKMQKVHQSDSELSLTYGAKQAQLVFRKTGRRIYDCQFKYWNIFNGKIEFVILCFD